MQFKWSRFYTSIHFTLYDLALRVELHYSISVQGELNINRYLVVLCQIYVKPNNKLIHLSFDIADYCLTLQDTKANLKTRNIFSYTFYFSVSFPICHNRQVAHTVLSSTNSSEALWTWLELIVKETTLWLNDPAPNRAPMGDLYEAP